MNLQKNNDMSIDEIITSIGKNNLYDTAKVILNTEIQESGGFTIENIRTIAEELHQTEQYFMARELYYKISSHAHFSKKDHQKLIQCIYKDPALSSEFKFKKALNEFEKYNWYSSTEMDSESYGLIGAIYKRWYNFSRNLSHLYLSLEFYEKGKNIWLNNNVNNDEGYCAINAAFILDMISDHLKSQSNEFLTNDIFFKKIEESENLAKKYREEILLKYSERNLTTDTYWRFATLLEVNIGLKKWDEVIQLTRYYESNKLNPSLWKLKSLFEQLKQLYRFLKKNSGTNNFNSKEIDDTFLKIQKTVFGFNCKGSLFDSPVKTGIALSGGGFRASYFHIGVLAALAEKDQLRNIEVISCVSGGSILGASYYLLLKNLLEQKKDDLISKDDYIKLVEQLICEFHQGVQKNLRIRLFTNLFSNFKMSFLTNYSRSNRIAELFEKYLYQPIVGFDNIKMNQLLIQPKEQPDFNIRTGNLLRINKVPQLVINATTLNTGHNFQFTATWLGEPPFSINQEVNGKWRIRRTYYNDFTNENKDILLRTAVGASACVPALFMGIKIPDLIKDKEVKLVDGGVRDNQGITAIMEAECKEVIISDASGQMGTIHQVISNPISEAKRSTDVSLEYIREFQLNKILDESKSGFFDKNILVHLKKDVKDEAIAPEKNNGINGIMFKEKAPSSNTKHGISVNLQRSLSEIRTDLDSFNDTEAYALMLSGYNQTMKELGDVVSHIEIPQSYNWKFKKVITPIRENENSVLDIIKNGTGLFFKWMFSFKKYFKIISAITLILLIGIFLYFLKDFNFDSLVLICSYRIEMFKNFCNQFSKQSFSFLKFTIFLLIFIPLNFGGRYYRMLGLKRPLLPSLIIFSGLFILFFAFGFYILALNSVYNKIGKLDC